MGIMGHPNPKLLMLGELFEKRGGYILLIYIYIWLIMINGYDMLWWYTVNIWWYTVNIWLWWWLMMVNKQLVGGVDFNPSEKYGFVSWDDDIPNWMGKTFSKPPISQIGDSCYSKGLTSVSNIENTSQDELEGYAVFMDIEKPLNWNHPLERTARQKKRKNCEYNHSQWHNHFS